MVRMRKPASVIPYSLMNSFGNLSSLEDMLDCMQPNPFYAVSLVSFWSNTTYHDLLTKLEPLIVSLPWYLIGGWKRRRPTGGKAYGMPRYSDTSVAFDVACPWILPLVVLTVCPSVHLPCWPASSVGDASDMVATSIPAIKERYLMLTMRSRHLMDVEDRSKIKPYLSSYNLIYAGYSNYLQR
jgi:hypothetical protein